jgi:hypothetical protein
MCKNPVFRYLAAREEEAMFPNANHELADVVTW